MELPVEKRLSRFSYAKVNLHLRIGDKREDGFHDLVSLFHLIDLHDDITVGTLSDGKGQLNIVGMDDIPPMENLMGQVALLFLERIGCEEDSVSISITKRIPLQGGLGGGSSNAATVLLTLNELYNFPLERDDLIGIALQVGSDIPFFIHQCPAAVVRGRGEFIEPVSPRDDLWGLIVFPEGAGIGTADAFRKYDEDRSLEDSGGNLYTYSNLCHMYDRPVRSWEFMNDFRSVVESYNDLYVELYNIAEKSETLHGTVSGSGAAFIFTSDEGPLSFDALKHTELPVTHVINFSIRYLNILDSSDTLETETSK